MNQLFGHISEGPLPWSPWSCSSSSPSSSSTRPLIGINSTLYGLTVIPRVLLSLIYLPIIAPRRLRKVETSTSSRNLFRHAHNVDVTLGPLPIISLVGAFSGVLRRIGCASLLPSVDCTAAWYNVTRAFVRDTQRFRYYYAAQDTELCLGLECPNCAERATDGTQSGVHPIIKPAFSQGLIATIAYGWDQIYVSFRWPTITGNNVVWRKDQIPWVGQTAIWLWATTPNEKNGKDRGLPFNTADLPFTSQNQTHMVIELSYEESGEANSNGFADFIGWKNVRDVREQIVPYFHDQNTQ
jgi:hypothetical protein